MLPHFQSARMFIQLHCISSQIISRILSFKWLHGKGLGHNMSICADLDGGGVSEEVDVFIMHQSTQIGAVRAPADALANRRLRRTPTYSRPRVLHASWRVVPTNSYTDASQSPTLACPAAPLTACVQRPHALLEKLVVSATSIEGPIEKKTNFRLISCSRGSTNP